MEPGGGQTGGYKMLHPALQPGLILQHVLNMHSQIILKYGPCIINGIFSTDSLTFFFNEARPNFVLNMPFSTIGFQLIILNLKE